MLVLYVLSLSSMGETKATAEISSKKNQEGCTAWQAANFMLSLLEGSQPAEQDPLRSDPASEHMNRKIENPMAVYTKGSTKRREDPLCGTTMGSREDVGFCSDPVYGAPFHPTRIKSHVDYGIFCLWVGD